MALLFSIVAKLLIFCISLSFFLLVNAKGTRLVVDLIHRDSPLSPLYNPNTTSHERYIDVVQRSNNRRKHLSKVISPNTRAYSTISPSIEYLIRIWLGSSVQEMFLSFDIGSNLLWVQCEPCNPNDCNYLEYPRFMPWGSNTYEILRCDDPKCSEIPFSWCDQERDICAYEYTYDDGSWTRGDLGYETITFLSTVLGDTFDFNHIIIGCSNANNGRNSNRLGGFVGLGLDQYSLFGQIEEYIDGTFSYCLPSLRGNDAEVGKLLFGENNIVGPDVTTTRLYSTGDGLYYLNLIAISIGNTRYDFPSPNFEEGNIVIDSGTPFFQVPNDYYQAITHHISYLLENAGAVKFHLGDDFLCYYPLEAIQVPLVTIHFGDTSMVLGHDNLFSPFGNFECFAFSPTDDDPIIGAIMQTNFWVKIEPWRESISFKPTDCINAEVL